MASHSSILGGSNAQRLLSCPASYHEQLRLPYRDHETSYAAEGTALHEAIAYCVEQKLKPEKLLGEVFYDHVIDADKVAVLKTAMDTLHRLLSRYDDTFKVVGIEDGLPLPGVTGAFGSVDLILAGRKTVVVADWKFGGGVPVPAIYSDEKGDMLNPQLAFYTCAARARYPRKFKGRTIVAAIIQPRLDEPLSYTETDDAELDGFLAAFQNAFLEALGRNAHREKGDWCKFASCKATCPLWTGPLFDLALIDPVKAALRAAANPTGYGAVLSSGLSMAAYAEEWVAEIRRQAHAYLEGGGAVAGWKLVPKRASRQWKDEDAVPDELYRLGADPGDILTEPELRSVAQMEKALKRNGIDLPSDLWHSVSSGTTIAPEDDARPDLSHGVVTEQLQKALKAL